MPPVSSGCVLPPTGQHEPFTLDIGRYKRTSGQRQATFRKSGFTLNGGTASGANAKRWP